jgi:hypothetical protein
VKIIDFNGIIGTLISSFLTGLGDSSVKSIFLSITFIENTFFNVHLSIFYISAHLELFVLF